MTSNNETSKSPIHKDLCDDYYENIVERVIISEDELKEIVARIGNEITERYRESVRSGRRLILVCVLKGAVIFFSDLIRRIKLPCQLAFIRASSYGGGLVSSGNVSLSDSIGLDSGEIEGSDLIIVEDILDSGHTLARMVDLFRDKKVNSVSVCVLISKPSRRVKEVKVDFLGKEISDEFIVGCGLDYEGEMRNLPFIGQLKPDSINNK